MYGFCCSKYSLSKKLLFQIKYQPDFAYKSVSYKEARNVVLQSTKHGEVTLPREFIFVFISYFTGLISSEKMSKVGGGSGNWSFQHTLQIYLFKFDNERVRTMSEICSNLTIKTSEWRHCQILHTVYVFSLWTSKCGQGALQL